MEEIRELAIGKFDGVHAAHKRLLEKLGEFGAILVIDNNSSILTPNRIKQELTNKPIFVSILESIKEIDGEDFIKSLQITFPNLEKIVVGYDFRFGRDRRYCAQDIAHFFPKECVIVDEVKIENISVHSGIIKELLKKRRYKEGKYPPLPPIYDNGSPDKRAGDR